MSYKLTKISGRPTSSHAVGTVITGRNLTNIVDGHPLILTSNVKINKDFGYDWFKTTSIKSFENRPEGGILVHTKNSTWLVEELP